jgi:integrase
LENHLKINAYQSKISVQRDKRRPVADGGNSGVGETRHQRLADCRQNRRWSSPASAVEKGRILGEELGDWAIWSVVEASAKEIGIEHFGAHDLRRTCAKLCRKNGGDLEQIKFLLGHSSIQTTERYLGSQQEIVIAVNDNLGL